MGKIIIGIDPGANGGIAIVDGAELSAYNMPATPADLLAFIKQYQDNAICYMEKVGGMPGNGGSAMFNFGKGYGHLEMALIAAGIPTVTVTPAKWQKHFQLGTGAGKTKTEWKNILKAKSQQLCPRLKVTLKTADAILIALYGVYEEKH